LRAFLRGPAEYPAQGTSAFWRDAPRNAIEKLSECLGTTSSSASSALRC
jgi:hypothetical protein